MASVAPSQAAADRRAHLIREMAGSRRTRSDDSNSARSNDGSEGMHDRHDHALTPRRDTEFHINTSALKRAFPAFSQSGSSDGEPSVEIGRGNNDHSLGFRSDDASYQFSLADGTNYKLMGTPPFKPRKNSKSAAEARPTVTTARGKDGASALRELDAAALNKRGKPSKAKPVDDSDTLDEESRLEKEQAPNAGSTYQSFAVPDISHITELIAGIAATPLQSARKTKPRPWTPHNTHRNAPAPSHAPIGKLSVPPEVQALYISLQLLQEKVTALENDKVMTEKKLEDQELETLQLKSRLEAYRHRDNNDSGLGSDDEQPAPEAEKQSRLKSVTLLRLDLEAAIQLLQQRLDKATVKIYKSEARVASLLKERDVLGRRLASAYADAKARSGSGAAGSKLHDDAASLRAEFAAATAAHTRQMASLRSKEAELRAKIDRREKAINQMAALAKELWSTRTALASAEEGKTVSVVAPALRNAKVRRRASQQSMPQAVAREAAPEPEPIQDPEPTVTLRLQPFAHAHAPALPKDNTFLSFMEGDEVAKLRLVVEDDKDKLAQLSQLGQLGGMQQLSARGGRSAPGLAGTAPKKSSMKKVSYSQMAADDQDVKDHEIGASSRGREPRRRPSSQHESTSAFLVTDLAYATPPEAPASVGTAAASSTTQRHHMTVPRPEPVSDRAEQPTDAATDDVDGLDATLRPAQDPGIALATVLAGLETELALLRSQLVVLENAYNKHDPALSRRKRKLLFGRIQKLLAAMDARSDQIYMLYDVLEGQKASGQLMTQAEVDVTLQNIGLSSVQDTTIRHAMVHEGDEGEDEADADADLDSIPGLDDDLTTWHGFAAQTQTTLDRILA